MRRLCTIGMAICVALWMAGCSGSDAGDATTTVSDDTLAQINDFTDDLQALEVVQSPLQEFVYLLESIPNGNPEGLNRITGMLYLDGAARAAGYMAHIPEQWREGFGGACLAGWSSVYSIISRYSVGPSLFVFDPADMLDVPHGSQGSVATSEYMNFAFSGGRYLAAGALQKQEGSASALWNLLSSAVYDFIVPGTRTFAVFGSSDGVHSGIGYKITQDNGNLCGGYCAYDADDYYNYY